MKQVLLVATVGGFVPQFELNDVKLLREMNCEVHYAANFDCSVYNVTDELLEENNIIKHDVAIAKKPFNVKSNYRAYIELKSLIDKQNIELVHCHTPVGGVIARVAAARSKRKPKVIYTAHGFHFYKGSSLLSWCTYYFVERILARKTDAIVTINEEDYIHARKFHLKKGGKVYKIPGVGLRMERFRKASVNRYKEDIQPGSTVGKKKFKLVTVAELNKNKNHQIVIEAIARLGRDDIYYEIYGGGPYEKYLRELIDRLKLGKYVQLKGYTQEPERVLRKADCFVFPSFREGLGMAALEAMACGLPVIANDNRGTREYMRDGYNGIVCISGKNEEYASAIVRLADSKETREMMGRNAINTAEKFDIKHTEETMRQVYSTFV